MSAAAPPALVFDRVTFAYQGAVMRFDLAVPAGEWLAIIGPSGAGKSTLLDLAAGFVAPDAGRIRIGDADVTTLPPSERPVSFVFQENNLFAHLTAAENVALGLAPRLRLSRAVRAKAGEALAAVGLAGFERRRPGEMSGGERQRVALARAFLRDRPLILLDEPFAALGPALRLEMLHLLQNLRARNGARPTTILMVTHQPEDARGFADRTAFVGEGQIRALGPTAAILSGADDPAVAAYLGRA
ncbi:thiamine ABC transporter ATP-binding protein [Mangrovibrevibacter kandeliae]|uniref:thiamine ABC transporter ATP-binding protein n=1 Tax=Mangrovibrevibacter kandeliae TaxID=2968473 RepID=UPI0021175824|nr:thiamine ABC transporter ATP-binding protein [Aurantimonas sp. CSK15Z-1]